MSARSSRRVATGLTLVEVLIVLTVVGVLLALAVPGLSQARRKGLEAKCLANARQLGALVVAYSVDYKGYFPTWISDGPPISSNPAAWRAYALQGGRLFNHTRWIRYSGVDSRQPLYRCPANLEYREIGDKAKFDYYASDSMYADPKFLDPSLPRSEWEGKFGGRAQQLDAARFPWAKVGLFEWWVWHAFTGAYDARVEPPGLNVTSTRGRATMWFLDGSASLFQYWDALPAVDRRPGWYSAPIWLTAHGVWGRDRASLSGPTPESVGRPANMRQ